MTRRDFQSRDELNEWLAAAGIDTQDWGKAGTKTPDDLWQEYAAGESAFVDDPPGRLVEVVQLFIRRGGALLVELAQEFADGRGRVRMLPPSEKLKGDEAPRAAALRCLREELWLTEKDVRLAETAKTVEDAAVAPSYPGLLTHYTFHMFEATTESLPDEDFYRSNAAPDDPIRRHLWGWREEA